MRVQRFTVLLAASGLLAILTIPALAQQRVALVIGNAQYTHAPVLANPLNDASDIGASLARLGFAVTKLENADQASLRRGLQAFSLAAAAAEIAVVFYAGHGIEVDQRNFLVPVDAKLASDQDVEFDTVPLALVMRSVGRASGLRLVILDACRANPFAVAMQRAGATRSIGRGLARVEPAGETLVAYAAKGGTVAADGEGRNSPYSKALLAHLEEPGLEIGLMFRKVRDAVVASTGGRQEPFVYGSLSSREVYLTVRTAAEPPAAGALGAGGQAAGDAESDLVDEREIELEYWRSVKDSTNAADFEAYLSRYPQGRFALLARNRLAALQRPSSTPAPTPEATAESLEAELGLERRDRRLIQLGLLAEGFDPGPADGLFGRGTRGAIDRWQASQGEVSTGYLDMDAAKLLLALGRKRENRGRARREAEEKAADDTAYAQAKSVGTVESYEAYLIAYPSGRHTEETRRLLAKAQERLAATTEAPSQREEALRDAAEALSEALATTQRIGDDFRRVLAFASIAQAQAKAGKFHDAEKSLSEALATAQRIGDDSPRVLVFASIAQAQAKAGKFHDAEKSLSEALVTAQRIGDDSQRAPAFAFIAQAQAEAGKFHDALATAQRIGDDPPRALAFVFIAQAQAKAGKFHDAEKSLSEALATAQRIGDDSPRASAFVFIAQAQAKAGNVRDAEKSFSEALATAQRIGDGPLRVFAFAFIAQEQAEAGKFHDAEKSLSEALAAAQRIGPDYADIFVFPVIAAVKAKAGKFRDALMTARRIGEKGDYQRSTRVHALVTIAETQAEMAESQTN